MLLAVPAASAQTHSGPAGEGLYLTGEVLRDDLAGSATRIYNWSAPAPAAAVPLTTTGFGIYFQHDPGANFTFTEDPVLRVPVGCTYAVPPLASVSAQLDHVAASQAVPLWSGVLALPAACPGVAANNVVLPLRLLSMQAGESLRLLIVANTVNVAQLDDLYIPTGAADQPAGLFGNVSLAVPAGSLNVGASWKGGAAPPASRHAFATDADGVRLRIEGNLTGAAASLAVAVRPVADTTTLFHGRYAPAAGDNSTHVSVDRLLPAGRGTRWWVEVEAAGERGAYNLTLEPVALRVGDDPAGPGANLTVQEMGASSAPPQASPIPLPFLAVAAAAALARKRHA
jgi:hypothetical protein